VALTVDPKDPNEVLDYTVDWTTRLDGDVIDTSTWILKSGDVTIGAMSFDGGSGVTKVWLSAGTVGVASEVTNRITTAGGRTMDQTIKIKIKEK
jgi:hypothetical protein